MQYKDLLADMAQMMHPEDPDRLFLEWLTDNAGRLQKAVDELGVGPISEGTGFYGRLKDAVTPILERQRREGW
jgi:hypothetical protein